MHSSLPGKAAEIRALLLTLIDTLPEGAALPPERELSARWNVARMTLRRAVDELVIEELLVRRRRQRHLHHSPEGGEVARHDGLFRGHPPHGACSPAARCSSSAGEKAERSVARRLRIPVGDPVLTFTRLRLADDLPMVVERTTLPDSYVPGIEAADLNGSLYELLTSRYGIELVSGTSKLEPVMPDVRTSKLARHPHHAAVPRPQRRQLRPPGARLRVHVGGLPR